ncbi:trypsin-like serine protease [Streptomyces sp. NPDC006660]|uniref:trypsin-like serine protease n=1 Tax=Streptomyces sp. NPDC006660 TaxID=3156901 RepID=UPI0033F58ED3
MTAKISRITWMATLLSTAVATSLLSSAPASALVGKDTPDGAYGFTAKLNVGGQRACTGALVDPQWVITAASCFTIDGKPAETGKLPVATTVTVGRTDLTTTAGSVVDASYLVPHPDRDVAMVRLARPVTGITPVEVATTVPNAADKLTAAGFGRTRSEWVPNKQHTATFTVGSVDTKSVDLKGAADAVICQGDAGGPALRDNNGSPELVAINSLSWQGGCLGTDPAETRTNAIGVRVDNLGEWIGKNRLATIDQDQVRLVTTADFNKDGRPDIAAILKDGNLHAFYTAADGTLVYGRELWRHDGTWDRKTRIFGGDFNGDGNADIAAMKGDGTFDLYPGTDGGQLGEPKRWWYDTSWASYPNIATYRAKGWDRDGLIATSTEGRLYAYPTGTDGILDGSRTEVWHDATWTKRLITTGDFNGDKLNDIAAISTAGELDSYAGKTDGKFDYGTNMWTDQTWGTYSTLMGGDFNGDGKGDIAAINGSGSLYLYAGTGNAKLAEPIAMWPTIG